MPPCLPSPLPPTCRFPSLPPPTATHLCTTCPTMPIPASRYSTPPHHTPFAATWRLPSLLLAGTTPPTTPATLPQFCGARFHWLPPPRSARPWPLHLDAHAAHATHHRATYTPWTGGRWAPYGGRTATQAALADCLAGLLIVVAARPSLLGAHFYTFHLAHARTLSLRARQKRGGAHTYGHYITFTPHWAFCASTYLLISPLHYTIASSHAYLHTPCLLMKMDQD